MRIMGVLVAWACLGTLFAYHQWDYSPIQSLTFALACITTTGLEGPPGTTESLLATAVFSAVAVPLCALFTSYTTVAVAKPFLRDRHAFLRRQVIKFVHATAEAFGSSNRSNFANFTHALDKVFVRFDRNQTKLLNYDEMKEFIETVSTFDGHAFEVTDDDIDWFMAEMDTDVNGVISKREFVGGILRWMRLKSARENENSLM